MKTTNGPAACMSPPSLLALFTSWSAGIGGMIAALIVWVMKKDESRVIRTHAAEAFNFNFSMFIYTLVARSSCR